VDDKILNWLWNRDYDVKHYMSEFKSMLRDLVDDYGEELEAEKVRADKAEERLEELSKINRRDFEDKKAAEQKVERLETCLKEIREEIAEYEVCGINPERILESINRALAETEGAG